MCPLHQPFALTFGSHIVPSHCVYKLCPRTVPCALTLCPRIFSHSARTFCLTLCPGACSHTVPSRCALALCPRIVALALCLRTASFHCTLALYPRTVPSHWGQTVPHTAPTPCGILVTNPGLSWYSIHPRWVEGKRSC
jgi:hypothetical protein